MSTVQSIPRAASAQILIIDDDVWLAGTIESLLSAAGYRCTVENDPRTGLARLEREHPDLVVTDFKMPGMTGLELIADVRSRDADLPLILMTSFSSVENAIEALRHGATDYIIKPFNNDDFLHSVERALTEHRIKRDNRLLQRRLSRVSGQRKVLAGSSPPMRRLFGLIERVAKSDASVLIQGQSGTGKELVARAIHDASPRAQGPFVAINCGAIPADLLESELFGHTKGAFTGASAAREGLLQEADGGTLLLDEISELALGLQVKLLRVLQERQARAVGSNVTFSFDVRFLATSNRELSQQVKAGLFREDLYYRLNVINLHVPPLIERGDDVLELAERFMQAFARRMNKRISGMSPDFVDALKAHHWPGNVRELENLIERAVILAEDAQLSCRDTFDLLVWPGPDDQEDFAALSSEQDDLVDQEVASQERALSLAADRVGKPLSVEDYIRHVLETYQDRHTEIELARMLGIGRKALWVRRRKWGLLRSGKAG
jgi:DNA-binding NtrC family response regulator